MHEIRRCRRIIIVGCGTSYHAGLAVRHIFEELANLPVNIENASDFVDRNTPVFRDDVIIFVSQSGETKDTLDALKMCKTKGALTVGVINTVGSSIGRETDCGVHCNAGIEIGVCSTKAYISQIIVLVMIALSLGDRYSYRSRNIEIMKSLSAIGELMKTTLALDSQIKKIVDSWGEIDKKSVLVLGRGYNYATCLEGARKLQEVSLLHSEGILSGELKHGPLTLVDENQPIIMIVCGDKTLEKCLDEVRKVIGRNGKPVIICDEELKPALEYATDKILTIPKTVDCLKPLLTVIPLQLLAYHMAESRALCVDRPRALAKVITSQ